MATGGTNNDAARSYSGVRANRGLAGTLVSAVAEVGGGVRGRDPVERRAERPVRGVLVARRDPAQLGLDLRPGRLDRAQVGRVGRQVAVGEAGAAQQLAYRGRLV